MLEIEKDKKTKTAVVCPAVYGECETPAGAAAREEEAKGLVLAMGQAVVWCETVKMPAIAPGAFFGKGTLARLKEKCLETGAELLAVDRAITAVQQRNLEKALNIKVIDRTAVILEIFGQRAQTNEGKLQVELAHLTYQRGRLVRSWTHLERQRGGGGFLGGPGETQIELDRRHLDERIVKIKKELEKVRRTRSIQRAARVKVPYPAAALVGYTNAGKSTLFNRLSGAAAFAEDMLFATLDPTMRKISLGGGCDIILSDTVGFISNLPHELVMAFRATLEEVSEADVIIHVIDASNPECKKQRQDVLNVLHELGLHRIEHEANYIEVYNKTDRLAEERRERLLTRQNANMAAVSAADGSGTDYLLRILKEKFSAYGPVKTLVVDIGDGKKLAEAYRGGEVLERRDDGQRIYLRIRQREKPRRAIP